MASKQRERAETVTERFVGACRDVTIDDLTPAAEERTRTLVRDLLGVMLGSAPKTDSRISTSRSRSTVAASPRSSASRRGRRRRSSRTRTGRSRTASNSTTPTAARPSTRSPS